MFNVSIKNEYDQEIIGRLDLDASPAEYFTGCVKFCIELLNGGSELNKLFKNHGHTDSVVNTEMAPQIAISMCIGYIHKHPAFDADIIFDEAKPHINFSIFDKIRNLCHLPISNTSTHIEFLTLLSKLKIEGIKSIEFTNQFSDNQRILYQHNFPDELIPDEFLCPLTSQVMDNPSYINNLSEQISDKKSILKVIEETGKNPYTNLAFENGDSINDEINLKEKIENFIEKVKLVSMIFPEDYTEKYTVYKEEIQGSLTADEFKKILETNSLVEDQSTVEKKNEQALALYSEAIKLYYDKKYHEALDKLNYILPIFLDQVGKEQEILKCYSTIISCLRELKMYDAAIMHAEKVIKEVPAEIDLTPIINKYHQCLKLKGVNSRDLYNQAVQDYQSKYYNLAINKLVVAIDFFDQNSDKAQIATCNSTLASCYRELGLFQKAKEHCEMALELRKQFLSKDDKLILATEEKLNNLLAIIQDLEKNKLNLKK